MTRFMTVWGIALSLAFSVSAARGQGGPEATEPRSLGLAALRRAAEADKYVFLFFWKEKDRRTESLWGVCRSAMTGLADRSDCVAVRVDDANERPVVERFGVSRTPLPLVLAVAPNGAVTKGFPGAFDEAQLRAAIVSPGTARCLKALQDRKLVLLCVGASAGDEVTVPRGVVAFQSDAGYARVTEVVALNARDREETSFLQGLGVDPRSTQTTTVMLVPPGTVVGKFEGAVTKAQMMARLASARSGSCAGGQCGPNGCGPR
jgi:hypothetical protein